MSGQVYFGRGDDTVGNPHRAQFSQFELFELILLLKSDERFPVERFEATGSHSTVPVPPPLLILYHIMGCHITSCRDMSYHVISCRVVLYCVILYCIVLCRIVLYYIVLGCIVLYCILLYCIVLYCIGLGWVGLGLVGLCCAGWQAASWLVSEPAGQPACWHQAWFYFSMGACPLKCYKLLGKCMKVKESAANLREVDGNQPYCRKSPAKHKPRHQVSTIIILCHSV